MAGAEAVLSDWYEAPVILTSSGRGAILLCLRQFGLNRYRDNIALPKMISACVLDAVTRQGFPVDAASGQARALTIFYHQYGFAQLARPDGPALEDICHSFFATEHTGARKWKGKAAIFSLPKFFRTADMAGGIVTPDAQVAAQLREARDAAGAGSPADLAQASGPKLEHIYLDRLLHPAITAAQLGGLPASLAEIRASGTRRRDIIDQYLAASAPFAMPAGWRDLLRATLPFVFPVFGPEAALRRLDAALQEISIQAGLYRIDTARDMAAPVLASALLVPCHQHIGPGVCAGIARLIAAAQPAATGA